MTAEEPIIICQPEGAGEKGALPRRKTIHTTCCFCLIPTHKSVLAQFAFDCLYGSPYASVFGWKEAHERNHEMTRVHPLYRTIRCDPSHHFGMCKMLPGTPYLPYALVRQLPSSFEKLE